jgi:hypothetical protein
VLHGDSAWAWLFLALLAAALVAYVVGLALLRGGAVRRGVVALALAIQLVPLGAPLLLSSDAYTYWMYGGLARAGGNPYRDEPRDYAQIAPYEWMGSAWHDRTSVYGPAFTLASEAVDGEQHSYAAWAYKAAAAAAMAIVVLIAARRSAFAAAFVGWNPVVAAHMAGGGHNDAWLIALVAAALALGPAGRRQAAGIAWSLAIFVKWIPLVFLPLRALEARATRRAVGHLGFAVATMLLVAVATWQFGREWLDAVVPLANNVQLTSEFALPHRLSQLGIPQSAAIAVFAVLFAAVYVRLAREAWRGRARLALAAGMLVLCSPYVAVWYLGWVVPLAALEEDRTARILALALTAYLLPQTIPV